MVRETGEQTWIQSIMLLVWQPHAAMSEDDWGSRTSLSIKWYGWMGRFGPKMAGLSTFQKGAKGTKMVNLSVFDPLGPFWIHLDPFGPFQTKIDFLLWSTSAKPNFVHLGQKIHFCLKWSNRVQIGPKWPKIVNNTYAAQLGPFWTLSGHFGALASLVSKMIVKMRAGLLQMPSLEHCWM